MKINTDKDCKIIIYNDVPVDPLNQISLFVVQLNKANTSTNIYTRLTNEDVLTIDPQSQGFISVCQIVLPKVDSIEEYDPLEYMNNSYVKIKNYIKTEEIHELVRSNDGTYDPEESDDDDDDEQSVVGGYFAVNTTIYYKDIKNRYREVSISEILEINNEAYGLYKEIKNFFSVCYLRKCYVALCQKIFNERAFDRCFNSKVDPQLIYRRDLVWSALNVIQYMIDSNQLAEAERLLERINGCNGLCANINTGEDCGCDRQ